MVCVLADNNRWSLSLQTTVAGLCPCRHQSLVCVLADISRWSLSLQTSVAGLCPCRHQSLVCVVADISRWSVSLRTAVVDLTDWSTRVLFQTKLVGSLSFLTTVIGLRRPSRQRPCWSSVLADNSHWSRMFLQTTVVGLYQASFEKTVDGLECPCRQQSWGQECASTSR